MPSHGSLSCDASQDTGATVIDLRPVLAAASAGQGNEAALPDEIMLVPAGRVPTRPHDGREAWLNDDPASAIANSLALGRDLIIDYEHASIFKKGEPIPAAGWITGLFERAGAIWGKVQWTPKGAEHLRNREIRFISPMFDFAKASRRIVRLRGAALTNDPAMFLTAIASANSQPSHGDPDMDMTQIRAKLGLKDDATDADVLAKLDEQAHLLATASAAFASVATACGLKADAKAADIAAKAAELATAAAKTGNPDPTKWAPMELVTQIQSELKALKSEGTETAATAAVKDALKAGKVPPALEGWALDYARADLDGFRKYADQAPAIVGNRVIEKADPSKPGALSDAELAVCKVQGITEEQFRASQKEIADRVA